VRGAVESEGGLFIAAERRFGQLGRRDSRRGVDAT
jgi:hypothetical protein